MAQTNWQLVQSKLLEIIHTDVNHLCDVMMLETALAETIKKIKEGKYD